MYREDVLLAIWIVITIIQATFRFFCLLYVRLIIRVHTFASRQFVTKFNIKEASKYEKLRRLAGNRWWWPTKREAPKKNLFDLFRDAQEKNDG